jgi:hypothetical protein
MIRTVLLSLALSIAFGLPVAAAPWPYLQPGQTDPNQYQSRVAKEVQPYLSNCTAQFSTPQGEVFDQDAVVSCKAEQAQFAAEYYQALEGNAADKFDIGFIFQRGDDHGVKYNPIMGCAWWIEMSNTVWRLPHTTLDVALVNACSASQDAVNEAAVLQAEESRVASLTY